MNKKEAIQARNGEKKKKTVIEADKITEGVQSPASAMGFGGEETAWAS